MASRIKIFSTREDANRALSLNTPRKVIVADQSICLVRTSKGIFALKDACPHQRASLSEGKVNAFDEVICPLHEYRFNFINGREANYQCDDADVCHIEVETNGIFLAT